MLMWKGVLSYEDNLFCGTTVRHYTPQRITPQHILHASIRVNRKNRSPNRNRTDILELEIPCSVP